MFDFCAVFCALFFQDNTVVFLSNFQQLQANSSTSFPLHDSKKVLYCIMHQQFGLTFGSNVVRECGRMQCGALVRRQTETEFILESSRRKRPCRDDLSYLDSYLANEVSATEILMLPITFHFTTDRLTNIDEHDFESCFYFIGSLCSTTRLLCVSCVGQLHQDASESFDAFAQSDPVSCILDGNSPFFIGFFLSSKHSTKARIEFHMKMLCQVGAVVVHLKASKVATWYLVRQDSTPQLFGSLRSGFTFHSNKENTRTTETLCGFDIFFRGSLHSSTIVDPLSLKDKRVSRFHEKIPDTYGRQKIPFCSTVLRSVVLGNLFPMLDTCNFVSATLRPEQDIQTYIDIKNSETMHLIALLKFDEYKKLGPRHKTNYLSVVTLILSRTGLLDAEWVMRDSVFAVRVHIRQSFMLNRLDCFRASDHNRRLKQFYSTKERASGMTGTLTHEFVKELVAEYEKDRRKPKFNSPHINVTQSAASIFHVQLFEDDEFVKLRSQLCTYPTLEFHDNSCWMEAAVNSLLSINLARCRIYISTSKISNVFRRLIDLMCLYGHTFQNQVPILECMRCGVYPILEHDRTAPPILGDDGFRNVLEPDKGWGDYGLCMETLVIFFNDLGISFDLAGYSHDTVSQHGVPSFMTQHLRTDVVILQFEPGLQPTHEIELPESSHFCSCTAAVFGNGAHYFSAIKGLRDATWTVRDALVQEFQTFSNFGDAMKHSRVLHKGQGYFIMFAVYVQVS